jgi:hypothetical protein
MTAPLEIKCPKCGGETISKGRTTGGKPQRMCRPCNYRFVYPPELCYCGQPVATGQGRKQKRCEKHYVSEGERHKVAYKRGGVSKPAPKPAPAPVYVTPRTGKFPVIHHGALAIRIEAGTLYLSEQGQGLPATDVESALYEICVSLMGNKS